MDNMTALLQERAFQAAELGKLTEAVTKRGKVSADEQRKLDEGYSAIKALDVRIEAAESGSGQASQYPLADDGRSLGAVMGGELRSLFTSGGGAALVPSEQLGKVWDRLAASAVALKSGMTVIPTTASELRIPRLDSDLVAAWTEEGEAINASDPTLTPLVATPRKLAALAGASNELVLDSNPAVLDLVLSNLLRALANGLDAAIFNGSGEAPELKGLLQYDDIQSIDLGTDGAPLTDLDAFAEALSMLQNVGAEGTAVVMHPRDWAQLLVLKEAVDSIKPLLSESAGSPTGGVQRSLFGVPVWLSSALPINQTKGTAHNASSILIYQADQLVAVRREEARIEIDRSVWFETDQVAIRGIVRYDFVVPNVDAVVRLDGVIPFGS